MSVIERRFHDTAKALKPRQELKASRYWVGVLYPDKKPTDQLTEIDFLWIKATGKITVKTIYEQVKNKVMVNVVLKLSCDDLPLKEETLAQLNHFNDNVIIFRAVPASSPEARTPLRTPLAPTNAQVTLKPAYNDAVDAKPLHIVQRAPGPVPGVDRSSTPRSKYGHGVGIPGEDGHVAPSFDAQSENRQPSEFPYHSGQLVADRSSMPPSLPPSLPQSNYGHGFGTNQGGVGPPGEDGHVARWFDAQSENRHPVEVSYHSGQRVADRSSMPPSMPPTLPPTVPLTMSSTLPPCVMREILPYPPVDARLVVQPHAQLNATQHLQPYAPLSGIPHSSNGSQPAYPNLANHAAGAPSIKQEFSHIPSLAQPNDADQALDSRNSMLTSLTPAQCDGSVEESPAEQVNLEPQALKNTNLQTLAADKRPEILEKGVAEGLKLLEALKNPLLEEGGGEDAAQWLQQIETLKKQASRTRTVVGVVGNTGAGKSSVINAMLDEDRLVPTSCMRACTAVVTELSWNESEDKYSKYRAEVEFIQPEDWARELKILFDDLIDPSGHISREHVSMETEAGVAYAKIRAVYPKKMGDDLSKSSIETMMKEPDVQELLGTTRTIDEADCGRFYKRLQHYVDSREKVRARDKKDKKPVSKEMEFWPLIKVVRIYTKSDVLSTGAVVVDLPGVHDSNAARAAVAEGYIKQCTGLWIVAPINRAVDDKAAKSLLGESFKRQLKYDGTYSHVTFICSKTDDISITEAADSLGLDQVGADFDLIDEIKEEKENLEGDVKDLRESKLIYESTIEDLTNKVEEWEIFRDDVREGKTVYAPKEDLKRKRSADDNSSRKSSKKARVTISSDDSDSDNSDESEDEVESRIEDDKDGTDDDDASEDGEKLELNASNIDDKLEEYKNTRKEARRQIGEIDERIREVCRRIKALTASQAEIEANISALCIDGRNQYSQEAIRLDFAAGIKELDQENAAEEDEANFNPEEDIRDYDEVARSLPVFCVSSRAYQKLSGRLIKDKPVPGFTTVEQTEIPRLQAHCKKLTEAGRASSCRAFLNGLCQLLTSLSLWSNNVGTTTTLSDVRRKSEAEFLKKKLDGLEGDLEKVVREFLKEMSGALEDNIYAKYDAAIALAMNKATPTCAKWGAPIDRSNPAASGLYWATYKAVCRRDGAYGNARGSHDFNAQLAEPLIKSLATGWEKSFARRVPHVLQSFTANSSALLKSFHKSVEVRVRQKGFGIAGLAMLGQQLRNYQQAFADLSKALIEQINRLQREANREFTPTIVAAMQPAYFLCVAECGSGSFMRMKGHMNSHVESERSRMFHEATAHVKDLLMHMCRQVEDSMASRADEIFLMMQRDYMSIIGGANTHGATVPKTERTIKREVGLQIDEADEVFRKVVKGVDDGENDASGVSAGEEVGSPRNSVDPEEEDNGDTNDHSTEDGRRTNSISKVEASANVDSSTLQDSTNATNSTPGLSTDESPPVEEKHEREFSAPAHVKEESDYRSCSSPDSEEE